jgi:hypothetical protein
MAARRDLFEQLFPIVFEEEIARINREFDALPKTTRKERKPAATLKYSLFHCECGLSHRIPPTRADYTAKGAEFVCPRLGKRVQATWRKSA